MKTLECYFTEEELSGLDKTRIPEHIAIIPDGNRRWARQQSSKVQAGHSEGAGNLITILRAGHQLGVKALTFYLFSTENWTRPPEEVQALMLLLEQFLIDQREMMLEEGVRFQTIGNLIALPESTQAIIAESKQVTAHCNQIDMVAALNYGSRDEICRAVKRIAADCERGLLAKEQITEETISKYLDTTPWKDPDLVIRSSGETRLSNYLLWQISYAEIFITETLWPDFRPQHLLEAVQFYQSRNRRLGGF